MVITGRLHMSLPFMAMGIPVITVHRCGEGKISECRFSGLDRILNYYTPSEYDRINWTPAEPDLEELKEKTILAAMQRIRETASKYQTMLELSEFYEEYASKELYYTGPGASYVTERQKQRFIQRERGYMDETTWLEFVTNKTLKDQHLIVYGAGDKGGWLLHRFQQYISQVLTFDLVDSDPGKWGHIFERPLTDGAKIFQYQIQSPEIIRKYETYRLLIIVAADKYYEGAGYAIAKKLIDEFGLQEGKHFFMLDKLNNSMYVKITEAADPERWHAWL